jgi:5-methylcytosine-specific restriction protein A
LAYPAIADRMALRSISPRLSRPALSRLAPRPKVAESFYKSDRWRALVSAIKTERGRRCEACGKTREQDGSPVKLILDHIIERKDGGADYDRSNLQLLCTAEGGNGRPHAGGAVGGCHNRKTARAKAKRNAL